MLLSQCHRSMAHASDNLATCNNTSDMPVKTATCDILVTGFGRYPGVRHNPAAVLATRVNRQLGQSGCTSRALVMPVTYGAGLALLRSQVAQFEMFARSNPSPLHADASGRVPHAGHGAARPRRSTAQPDIALAILHASGARARLSASAGRYLCNASYALALEQACPAPVLFIHIPHVAQWQVGSAVLVRAMARIGRQMTVQARRR
jgi:pyroglutamyl-peptidase